MYFRFSGVAAAALLLVGCNTTSQGPGSTLTDARYQVIEAKLTQGNHLTWGPFASVGGNCRLSGQARGAITQQPSFGKASVVKLPGEVVFLAGQKLSKCNGTALRGTSVRYQPDRDHFGDDQFKFRLVFPDGETRDYTVNVHRRRE